MGTGCLANIVRISCFQFQTPSVHWEPIDPGEANDPGRPGDTHGVRGFDHRRMYWLGGDIDSDPGHAPEAVGNWCVHELFR